MSDRSNSRRRRSNSSGNVLAKGLVVAVTMGAGYLIGMYLVGPAVSHTNTAPPASTIQAPVAPTPSATVPDGSDPTGQPIAVITEPRRHRTGTTTTGDPAKRKHRVQPAVGDGTPVDGALTGNGALSSPDVGGSSDSATTHTDISPGVGDQTPVKVHKPAHKPKPAPANQPGDTTAPGVGDQTNHGASNQAGSSHWSAA